MARRKSPPKSKKAKRGASKAKTAKSASVKPKKAAAKTKAKARRKTAAKPQLAPELLLPSRAASTLWWRRPNPLTRYQLQMAGVAITATAMVLVAAGLIQNIAGLDAVAKQTAAATTQTHTLSGKLGAVSAQLSALESLQAGDGGDVVNTAQLDQQLGDIKLDLAVGDTAAAGPLLARLQQQLATANVKIIASSAGVQPTANPVSLNVPILLYHQPPPDFVAQMAVLQQRNYTTITLDQLAAALIGKTTLPAKPVIITFDDGLSNQLPAAGTLAALHMKATFFIIDGGAGSDYCIGAGRHPGPCGQDYMTWNQVRQLDRNPLFTVASHTVDHLDLPTVSADIQSFEIISGKQQLEQQLSHRVDDFAYPYGDLDATTLALVHQAGFIAAVTTQAGTAQTTGTLLAMPRIRTTYDLP